MTLLDSSATLKRLGYAPNEPLLEQVKRIEANTAGYAKIQKHMFDLHDRLKIEEGYVAMSNTLDLFKIKVEATDQERQNRAFEQINAFATKYKINLQKIRNKNTYYIVGFDKE